MIKEQEDDTEGRFYTAVSCNSQCAASNVPQLPQYMSSWSVDALQLGQVGVIMFSPVSASGSADSISSICSSELQVLFQSLGAPILQFFLLMHLLRFLIQTVAFGVH